MLLLTTQIQAQINPCDSITYWTDQGQGLSVGLDTSNIVHNPDSIQVWWSVCNTSMCYGGSGINDFFGQITTSDTIKVCYDALLYTSNTVEICTHCDSLVFDQNLFSWIMFSMGNPVGIVEIENKINNNKMYDLQGREILKPKGLYIQNNIIKYER
tara:strand:- start:32 stop:499 length:468 start_codon:yes stop_codon:yes gene_type:complete